MKSPAGWRQSKFELHPRTGVLRTRRDRKGLPGSRLVGDRTAAFYSRAIPQYAQGSLLDLGCGNAPLLGYYSDFVDSVTLVDWANSRHANPLLDLICDLNEPLLLEAEKFDTVILSDVLEHIRKPQELLNEISRVLRSGTGVLLMNVPFYYSIHEEPFDFYRYTRYALNDMCERSGLRIIEISSLGGIPEIIIDLMSKVLQQLPVAGRASAAIVQAVGALLADHGPGRLLSARSEDRFPLGYSLIAVKERGEDRTRAVCEGPD
ncbi:class I SAM-dependent methyltransferase [Mycobacterium sp. 236(2023)]|uniref:class I SAM-dependent methyltransferase n=1 Tax=Mycobacterium sp. 236(2023) TaxID=3038163 RepID=UPI002414DD8D|nr:class I SAM-dependent methyltransferase [Mycobacterium sp. 236(2023)]MDG4664235.1 class I SAM-dependent methyltransferase [Mycobacterium sp. 236(2023)]